MSQYLGYYLSGKLRKISTTETVDECERDASHKLVSGNFCPTCGGAVVIAEKPSSRIVDIYDVPEDEGFLEDRFIFPPYAAPPGEFIAISNYNNQNHLHSLADEDGSVICLDVDTTLKADMYDKFMEKHEVDIKLLSAHVFDEIEVKFGIITYYM